MTVEELIEQLKLQDLERVVVMAKDGEGNCYSPYDGFWHGLYVADSTWSGEMHVERDADGNPPEGYDEEDCYDGDDAKPALVLCPVN